MLAKLWCVVASVSGHLPPNSPALLHCGYCGTLDKVFSGYFRTTHSPAKASLKIKTKFKFVKTCFLHTHLIWLFFPILTLKLTSLNTVQCTTPWPSYKLRNTWHRSSRLGSANDQYPRSQGTGVQWVQCGVNDPSSAESILLPDICSAFVSSWGKQAKSNLCNSHLA